MSAQIEKEQGKQEVYTEAEFCKLARICRATAQKLRFAGKLGHLTVGRKILYTPAHLQEFIAQNEQPIKAQYREKKS